MAKDANQTVVKPASKKHEARLAREKRQKKIITSVVLGIVAVVILLVGYGVLDNMVLKTRKPVAKVGDTTITVNQFVKRVQYERLSQVETFSNYMASGYGQFFQAQLLEMQNALDNYIQFGSDTLDKMINEAVIAEKARELGITVTDEEIDKELERGFGFFPNGTPTAEPTFAFKPTATFSPTQLVLITKTPTPAPTPTELPTPIDPTATATLEPTSSTPTEAPTATSIPPTATPYTRAGFESMYQNMLTNIGSQFEYTDADFRAYVYSLLLNQKVFDYVTKDISREQDMVWARHILVATEEEAQTVLDRLAAGEEWGAIAAEVSTDTSNNTTGGDLGWFTKGQMVTPFEDAAYALKVGEISKPVQTDFGYHIIQVLGHELRQMTDDQFETFKSQKYGEFIDEAKAGLDVKKLDVWASVVPSTPTVPAEYRISQ